jgi:hypothetical protein
MSISNKIINVSGEKLECIVLAETAIQLMSKSFASIEEFNETWNKTLTLVTKSEIKYEDIKSISKEEGEEEITIHTKGMLGMAGERKMTFANPDEREAFYQFFQTQKGFVRTDETLSPLKSAMPYLGGLALTLLATAYGYYLSSQMASGEFVEELGASRGARRGRLISNIVEMLGTNGVLALGLGISAYIVYKIWDRYKNPPVQTKLVPGV